MRLALAQARLAAAAHGAGGRGGTPGPCDRQGGNAPIGRHDPSAHAEMLALPAAQALGDPGWTTANCM